MSLLAAAWLQVRVELSDEQRELYKAILGRNYSALVGEFVQPARVWCLGVRHAIPCHPPLASVLRAYSARFRLLIKGLQFRTPTSSLALTQTAGAQATFPHTWLHVI